MASRVGLLALLGVVVHAQLGSAAFAPASTVYTIRVDPRLCPSPMCGGYWVARANATRTRCQDGMRRPRCYVARAAAATGGDVDIADGALARGTIEPGRRDFGELHVSAVYRPAGSVPASGGFYRVFDTGLRCVRAPCFSYAAVQLNGSTRTRVSGVELTTARASPRELALGEAALATSAGVLVRGRFARTGNGGRMFRATRLFLKAQSPRA